MKYNIKLLVYIALALYLICSIIHAIVPEAIPIETLIKAISWSLFPIAILEFITLVSNLIKLIKLIGNSMWRNNKYWLYYILIILSATIYPIYVFITTDLENDVALTFYGSFITFIGTFSLGYFTFVKEIKYQSEIKLQKIKLLYDMLKQIDDMLYNLTNKKIEYDSNWLTNFYALESYIGVFDSSLKNALEKHLKMVNVINDISDLEEKRKYHIDYLLREEYSIESYNYNDLKEILHSCTYNNGIFFFYHKPWNEKEKIKKLIDEFAEQYYAIIENWIYSYMLKNKLTFVEYYSIELKLLDWLSKYITSNSVDKSIFDKPILIKRFIASFTFKSVVSIKRKSSKLYFEWGNIALHK